MRAKIRNYISPPGFADSDKTDFAAVLRALFITLLIISPVVLVVGLLVNNPKYVWGVISSDVVILGALGLLRRGFITVVSLLLPSVLLSLAMYFVFVGRGLNDTALLMFPLVIILAGLLLGRAGVMFFTLAAIFYTFFIFYVEEYDLISPCCNHIVGPNDPVAITVILATTAIIFELLNGRLSAALARTRRNEQALRESEAKLRLIYENAYDGISIYEELPNRSRRLIDCNDRYAEIAGRPKEELLRIGNTSLVQEKVSPEKSLEEILRIRRENRPYHGLFSWIRPDGKENIIEYSAAPVQVGDRPWTIGLDRDITEHRQITDKLRENEALLKTIINQIPFDLWVCDAEGRYMMQNAISYDLAGDLIGKTADDLELPPEVRAIYKQKHLQALSGQTVREELEVLVKGQPRILESVQAPIRDRERFLGLIGMRIDLTERVQAEAALRRRTAQLDALHQIGLELATKLDLESLLQSIVTRAQALLNGHRGGIFLYRPDLQALEMVATSDPVSPIPLGILIKPGDGLTGQTWQRGQTIMTNDYPAWQEKSAAMTRLITSGVAPSGSIISTPVWGDNEILGVLNVTAKAKNHFSPADAELLTLFAAQAAVAIHNARLHKQTQAYATQLEQEVAERKRVEAALRTSDERYRTFIAQSTEGISRYEFEPTLPIETPEAEQLERFFQDLDLAECNDAYARMYGFARADELIGAKFGVRFLRSNPENITYLQTYIRSGYRFKDMESSEVDKNGRTRYFSNNLIGIIEEGKLARIWGVQRDITERKQTELALLRRAEEMTALYETSLEINAELDLSLLLPAIVRRATTLLGVKMGTLVLRKPGHETMEIVATHNRPLSDLGVTFQLNEGVTGHVAQTGEPLVISDYRHWPGRAAHFANEQIGRALGVPLKQGQQVIGVLNVLDPQSGEFEENDTRLLNLFAAYATITIQNARLLEAEQYHREIAETLVAARTRELEATQERLIRQEKLAFLGQLAGGVGHELRNPLGVIANAIYFLRMVLAGADETIQEYLELIAGRVQEAEKIVTDLLNLSRAKSAAKERVPVSTLVAETLRRYPPPAQVTIKADIARERPVAMIDPQQIGQVLANLITNAYQAMPNGGALTISAYSEQDWVKLSVADTGVGIASETLEKIFEPLFTTKAKGIGLGLAVSKNLVEVNGGAIEVESIEEQGTTFTLTLPTPPLSPESEPVILNRR